MHDLPPGLRRQIAVQRAVTQTLKRLGLRERALSALLAHRRRKRRRAEARGSDALSHPALHDMDRKLDAILDRDGGFFVEAGANDGFTQSNTYWLERFRGWRGILVEPMAELAAEARLERPDSTVVECALVPADFAGDAVELQFGDLMTTVKGTHGDDATWSAPGTLIGWRDPYVAQVPARTLSSVLDEAGAAEVDLLSLDVEGYEPQVLRGLDLDRHAPRYILVEMHDLEAGRAEIGAVLGDRYEEIDQLSPLDVLYRRSDLAASSSSGGTARSTSAPSE